MKTYFKGEFSARRPITVGIAVGLILCGLGLIPVLLPLVVHGLAWENVTPAFLTGLFSLGFLAAGLLLLFQIVRIKKTSLLITSDGLRYGEQSYRWEDITELGVMPKYSNRFDLYCATRSLPVAIEVPTSAGLTPEEVKALFTILSRELVRSHPHIRFCETQ